MAEQIAVLMDLMSEIPRGSQRALIEVLCDNGLATITRLVERMGDEQHPVDVATAMVDLALKTGHADVLNSVLDKVDVTWPLEIVVAIWAATAPAADELPARDAMWQRLEARVLPR